MSVWTILGLMWIIIGASSDNTVMLCVGIFWLILGLNDN
jgi:hypothetical protein